MKDLYLQNLKLLNKNHVNTEEHDACGVGFVASMNGKPRREVVRKQMIQDLKLSNCYLQQIKI